MTSDPFVVTKQTPTKINIVNTTIANDARARVYFQVLDQYNDVMDNYTEKKLTARAYNATKGHDIPVVTPGSKKDYLMLDCSTETVTAGGQYLNAIGDKIGLVVYLTDNAAVSTTAELEIVRVYTDELTFGDVKLGNDKRVTENRTYELLYTAKTNEGKDAQFDRTQVGAAVGATRSIGNYHFITSNSTAVDMATFTVNNDGNFEFVAGDEGTAVITAINTITGATSSVKIVVNKPAQLSSIEVADASVAYDAEPNTKIKAAVVAYDQFGEVIDPRNVKNTNLSTAGFDSSLFSSVTSAPTESTYGISIEGITSDGKYVQYNVDATPGSANKGRTQTFTFVSKAMGETGYIRSTANVMIDDEIEASALEIVKAPSATASENSSVKLQVVVKDQYQNKMANGGLDGFDFSTTNANYYLNVRGTNRILTGVKSIKEVPGESRVYEIELKTNAVTSATHEPGTFTLELKEGQKVIASKTFDLTIVKTITDYTVKRDKASYKAGDKIKVDVDAYSGSYFNKYYNATVTAYVEVTGGAVTANKAYTKTLTFKDGVASFELTAGTAGDDYYVTVQNQNAYDNAGNKAGGASDTFNIVGNSAGKLALDKAIGKLRIYDSQGNKTTAWTRTDYATIKVMDERKSEDITSKVVVSTGAFEWNLVNDNTVDVTINSNNIITKFDGQEYDFGSTLNISGIPAENQGNVIVLSITVGDFTWSQKVVSNSANSGVEDFTVADAVAVYASRGVSSTVTGAVIAKMPTPNMSVSASAILAWLGNGATVSDVTTSAALQYVKEELEIESIINDALADAGYAGDYELKAVVENSNTFTWSDTTDENFVLKITLNQAGLDATTGDMLYTVVIDDDI